jgi:curli biogenesis system outer membrane secretion channel CsgG
MPRLCGSARTLLSLFLAVVFCAACSTVAVKVPVMKPAEINMAPYQSVAIGGLTERSSRVNYWYAYDRTLLNPMTGLLEEALVASNRFQVLDRSHLENVLREQKLSASDMADQNSVTKLGKVLTAGAFIFGDVTDSYRETRKAEKCSVLFDKKQHTCRDLTGEFYVQAHFKIIDVSTGRTIVAKTYEEKKSQTNSGTDSQPDAIDREALQGEARRAVVEHFMKAIVPHQEIVEAKFVKDGDIPQLEKGIVWAQRGEWSKAQDAFNTAAQDAEKNLKLKGPQIAKCYWNLGLSYEYAGDYDKAADLINKAYTASNDANMLNELDNVKRMQADARKLAAQTAAEVASSK